MWRKRTRGQARRTDRGPRSGARTARHDPAVAPAASESGHAAAACPSSQLTCPSWAGGRLLMALTPGSTGGPT